MTVKEIAAAVNGVWWNPREDAAPVTAVCTDSRKITPGCLFLPWVGEKFDGHDFIDMALDKGAAGCLCARLPRDIRPDKFYIKVDDTRLALRALASAYREKFAIPFVQITGSVGKTTTKEMIAAVLGVVAVAVLLFAPFLSYVIPMTAIASFIGFVVLALLLAGIAFLATHNLNVTAITGAAAVVPLSVIYILSRSSFEGLFPALLRFISPFAHFAAFCQFGTFSVQSLILLLSYPVLFVFLTVQSADKKRWD